MSIPAIENIITDTRERVRRSHHCVPPAESVILSLATQVHLLRKKVELLTADEKVGRLICASRTFVKDWRDGDFELPRLAQIHAEHIAERVTAIGGDHTACEVL